MSNDHDKHPVNELRTSTGILRAQTTYAAHKAHNDADSTRQAAADLGALDTDKVFSGLRKMVSMLTGSSQRNPDDPETPPKTKK